MDYNGKNEQSQEKFVIIDLNIFKSILKNPLFDRKVRVYLTILWFTHCYRKEQAKISFSTISKYTGITYRWNISQVIEELIKEKLIKRVGTGKGYRNGYYYSIIGNIILPVLKNKERLSLNISTPLNKYYKENIYIDFFDNLSLREKEIVDRTIDAIKSTRKTNKLSPNVLNKEYEYWNKFSKGSVISAMEIYLSKGCAASGKNEKYLRGIIRNEAAKPQVYTSADVTAEHIEKHGSITKALEFLNKKDDPALLAAIEEHGSVLKAKDALGYEQAETKITPEMIKRYGNVTNARAAMGIN